MSKDVTGEPYIQGEELPHNLYLGFTKGEWPVYAFINDAHAMIWLNQREGKQRLLWRVRLTDVQEVEIKTVAPRLVPRGAEPQDAG